MPASRSARPIEFKRLACVFVLTTLLGHFLAQAQVADTPLEDFIATDGIIFAMVETNNVLYFGGSFQNVGLRTGGGVPVDATTGIPEAVYPKVNGTVAQAISDGAGGWFIGGSFTRVGGFTHTNLAHIRFDRTVDPNWSPSTAGGSVGPLLLVSNTLYFGGNFTNVNGAARGLLAAVDATSGSLLGWNPAAASATIRAIALAGTNLYIGGDFTTVAGQTRLHLAAVSIITGQLAAWNPGTGTVYKMTVAGSRLFVCGNFTTIASQARSCIASFDVTTGNLEAWNPNITSTTLVTPVANTLVIDSNQTTVYIGGQFDRIGGTADVNVGAVDITTGLATSWNANADYGYSGTLPTASVSSLALNGNTLLVGGTLINIGGQPRLTVAALDTTTGLATPWNPTANLTVTTFSPSGNSIYLGGLFSVLNGIARTNMAAYNLTNRQVTPWNPPALGNPTTTAGTVQALLPIGGTMYVGGEFTNVCGVTRSNLAAVDLNTGALSDWNPSPNLYILALATWNGRLYAGGGFWTVGGVNRTNVAEFDLATGALTAWDPGLNRTAVHAVVVSGNTLYVGGLLSSVNGVTRRCVVGYDLTTGLPTAWNPNITGTGTEVDDILPYGNTIYLCGRFPLVGGLNRTNIVAVDAQTAQVFAFSNSTDLSVQSIVVVSNTLYAAGQFNNVAGKSQPHLAAFDAITGQLSPWNPKPDFFLERLLVSKNLLFASGSFLRIGGQTGRGIAAFPLIPNQPPQIASNSLARLGDGRLQFHITAPGAWQTTISASSNLTSWQPLQTLSVNNGDALFTGLATSNQPQRYYRVGVP